MRIGLTGFYRPAQGTTHLLLQMRDELVRQGHETSILPWRHYESPMPSDGVWMPYGHLPLDVAIWDQPHVIQGWIDKQRLDAVLWIEHVKPGEVGLVKATGRKTALLLLDDCMQPTDWYTLGRFDLVICPTFRSYHAAGQSTDRRRLVWWAVPPAASATAIPPRILHLAARPRPRRNTLLAIEAVWRVLAAQADAEFVVLSSDVFEGATRARLAELKAEFPDRVHVKTDVRDYRHVEHELSRGGILAYPTRREGLGLTALEAIAHGVPVIAADVAPLNEFIEHGRDGLLCPCERFQTADAIETGQVEIDTFTDYLAEAVKRRHEFSPRDGLTAAWESWQEQVRQAVGSLSE